MTEQERKQKTEDIKRRLKSGVIDKKTAAKELAALLIGDVSAASAPYIREHHTFDVRAPHLAKYGEGAIAWREWNSDTLADAVEQDRPLCLMLIKNSSRLSHAMRDNFDHDEIIRTLNEDFIPVLADADDEPHLTAAARAMCQILFGRSGWPLFLFMTPDRKPFFASSYMPRESSDPSTPGLLDILQRMKWLWAMKRPELTSAAESYSDSLKQALAPYGGGDLSTVTANAVKVLKERIDSVNGGFGTAPKFPDALKLVLERRLIESGKLAAEDEKILKTHFIKSLSSLGGKALFDCVSGGFFDFCLDDSWTCPVIGKHLNANIAMLEPFVLEYSLNPSPAPASTICGALCAATEFMTPCGLLSSGDEVSNDAELVSYYTWDTEEVKNLLGNKFDLFSRFFKITGEGNLRNPLTREPVPGYVIYPLGCDAEKGKTDEEICAMWSELEDCIDTLREADLEREAPALDSRVSVRSNALFAALMANAGRFIPETPYIDMARDLVSRIEEKCIISNRLCHVLYEELPGGVGTLEDYTALTSAYIALYRATDESGYLDKARKTSELTDNLFGAEGAWRLSVADIPSLCPVFDAGDGELPSAEGVAANTCVSLYKITGDESYAARAKSCLEAYSSALNEYPDVCASLVIALLRLENTDSE